MGGPRRLLPLSPSPPSRCGRKEDPRQEDFGGETGQEWREKRWDEGGKQKQGQEWEAGGSKKEKSCEEGGEEQE